MATSLRTKRRIFDLNRIILNMLNKASNFDHKYDISFSPTQYICYGFLQNVPNWNEILLLIMRILTEIQRFYCSGWNYVLHNPSFSCSRATFNTDIANWAQTVSFNCKNWFSTWMFNYNRISHAQVQLRHWMWLRELPSVYRHLFVIGQVNDEKHSKNAQERGFVPGTK